MKCRAQHREGSGKEPKAYPMKDERAESRQKSYANRRRRPLEFQEGDFVLLKVSPRKGVVQFGVKGKLAPRPNKIQVETRHSAQHGTETLGLELGISTPTDILQIEISSNSAEENRKLFENSPCKRMRRYSPQYYSPPRRDYGGRGRSPPRRGYGGGGGYGGRRKEQNHGSLLVRNIPLDCRPEELRVPFERFGVVRDVYIPKDYYTGTSQPHFHARFEIFSWVEPRGFAFVQFVDSYEASEAQYHMNGKTFAGREISVVVAAENGQDQAIGNGVHLIMDVLDLDLYPVHALPAIPQVLEADTTHGPALLLQSGVLTTLFPQIEGMQTIQDLQGVFHESKMAIVVVGHILRVLKMVLSKIQTMMGNLHTRLRMRKDIGGHLVEHQYHHLDPGVAGDRGDKKAAETSLGG
ncbi:Serine/arginine-rich splicing factor 12 [Morus notabilis]|uniref:Serine/arginine-rich splicing factor 12 n=1 Tax=Morus notabilis TaxID=981085 RepID=W9SPT4_9ROSA|nr:Serine/arginine-rich splicing factor 12 [Morus notabilis]